MYNTYVHDTYRRIIIVIDELAEILDKKRFPKAQHARIDNIIGYLSIIACTGRVFGVHLCEVAPRQHDHGRFSKLLTDRLFPCRHDRLSRP
jgi:DNA segregation ATPase FtsK/SpoIIIE-like protein